MQKIVSFGVSFLCNRMTKEEKGLYTGEYDSTFPQSFVHIPTGGLIVN
jgi:hypothetical protein